MKIAAWRVVPINVQKVHIIYAAGQRHDIMGIEP
jgi:hypothetical protein